MLYLNKNKSLKEILSKKILIIILLPLIIFFLISIIIVFYKENPNIINVFIAVLVFILFGFFVTKLLLHSFNKVINNTLTTLLSITRDIGAGNYQFSIPDIEITDFYHIAESFSIMANQIKTREDELNIYRNDLEEKVVQRTQELSIAHNKILETEKMASLGFLVSGISHELNTPLGIILTGITYMEGNLIKLNDDFTNKSITNSGLKTFIDSSLDTAGLVSVNSFKVSKLVKDFKMIAKDQECDDIRDFDIIDYTGIIIDNLQKKLKNTSIEIKLNFDVDITMHTYPGSYYKVMSNLILNSYSYGFKDDESGIIEITMRQNSENYEITYSDNGAGMDQVVIDRVFEPFYTTGRGKGSTGLGMFIVYNQLTQILKGSIESECIANSGVRFNLSFPINI